MSETRTYTSPNYHMLTAMYNWISENNGTPHIVVPLDQVPSQLHHYGKEGVITLNIAMRSTGNFSLDANFLAFNARFSGVDVRLNIPVNRILSIYDREWPERTFMAFAPSAESEQATQPTEQAPKRPTLSVVK